jgi:hypothetical protein
MTREPSGEDPSSSDPCPEEPGEGIAHSGAGAQTALLAMLKKRRMRATREIEPEPAAPPVKDTGKP